MFEELTRRRFAALLIGAGVSSRLCAHDALAQSGEAAPVSAFVHPGLLHNTHDLLRMKNAVAAREEPIFSGFVKLREHPQSQSSYVPEGASAEIGRNPNVRFLEFDNDCNAAYQCALMASITGEPAYWRIAIRVLDDWSGTLKRISGADAVLCASLGGFKLINAAELVRWNHEGWADPNMAQFCALLRDQIIPVLANFAPFANGNWDTASMKTLLAAAVFLDDRTLLERVLVYYNHGCGDGRLTNYIYVNGQCQESGRDQQHTQLGLAHLGDCCEIAWHQGLDLYGMTENRLLAGFEYTARYELGGELEFVPDIDRTGKYRHQVIAPRSALRPVYEQIYNHYVHRRGVSAPWTARAAAAVRPEGAGFQADHTGFGTLLYSRTGPDPGAKSMDKGALAGLQAANEHGAMRLSWVAPIRQDRIAIVRTGPGAETRRFLVSPGGSSFVDKTVKRGVLYQYQGETAGGMKSSTPLRVIAGCPDAWRMVGPGGTGGILCDGFSWSLFAPGSGLSHLFSVMTNTSKWNCLTARLLPEFASAVLHAGITVAGGSGDVIAGFLLEPASLVPAERGGWTVRLRSASFSGNVLESKAETALLPAQVRYGRLQAPVWLRLSWERGIVRAESSSDGAQWSAIGQASLAEPASMVGIGLASGAEQVPGSAVFDHVALSTR